MTPRPEPPGTQRSRAPVVVIGIGSPVRHDDGVGPAVLDHLAGRPSPLEHADLITLDGEPARMVEAWQGRQLAVVVDAVRSGTTPGTMHRLEIGLDPLPVQKSASSSHTTGLADAIALATALDRLPARLVLLGVEPGDVSLGLGLSPPIAATVPRLARQVATEVKTHTTDDEPKEVEHRGPIHRV